MFIKAAVFFITITCHFSEPTPLHFRLLASVMEVEVYQYVQDDLIVVHKPSPRITPNGVISIREYQGAWA